MTAATTTRKNVWQRWKRIAHHARDARNDRSLFIASAIIAILYNVIGALDVMSTLAGLQMQAGTEANPFLRVLMESLDNGWVMAKLALQLIASAMILWFPHRLVLGMFSVAVLLTAITVWNNFHVIGVL